MSETTVYLDNAATTRISDSVLEAMLPWLREGYGNASSVYSLGRKSAIALNKARAACAEILGCQTREVFFTSGGTESDNTAVFSAASVGREQGKRRIITSAFEHHAVLEPLKRLEKDGFDIVYLPVYREGVVRPADLEAALTPDTALVTVMAVNNETGTVQPAAELAAICAEHKVPFHTDAVQAFGNVPIDLKNVDMMSLSGHKLHAAKGVGLLYVKDGTPFRPYILGGAQQSGRRAGTENIAGIVGLARAMSDAAADMDAKNAKLLPLREKLITALSEFPGAMLNGSREKRIASNVNVSFPGKEGETLVLRLDLMGIAVSSGSACTSGSLDPSHVLTAMGLSHDEARSAIRITMSKYTGPADIDALISAMKTIIN